LIFFLIAITHLCSRRLHSSGQRFARPSSRPSTCPCLRLAPPRARLPPPPPRPTPPAPSRPTARAPVPAITRPLTTPATTAETGNGSFCLVIVHCLLRSVLVTFTAFTDWFYQVYQYFLPSLLITLTKYIFKLYQVF